MIEIRKSSDRGHEEHGWLDSYHSFSFGEYYNPQEMGFGPLRVINEDRVQPGKGFGTHGHSDMEIISYVLEGALEHRDSLGTGSVLHYGDVQRMSAGTGVRHSEFNSSNEEPLHFLQIWIEPNVRGIAPSYEEKRFEPETKRAQLRLIASGDGRENSVLVQQDVKIFATILEKAGNVRHTLELGRLAYLHLIRGQLAVNGNRLAAGDAVKVFHEDSVSVVGEEESEFLLFDLPR